MQHIKKNRKRGIGNRIGAWLLLPNCLLASSALVSWQPNQEADLAGYNIYYGSSSKTYPTKVNVGKTVQYTVTDLTAGTPYYFAITAYDTAGNESGYSSEVTYIAPDNEPPVLVSASCLLMDKVRVRFNEPVDSTSAQIKANYTISGGIVVQNAVLQSDKINVDLYTTQHVTGNYTLTVSGVKDTASVPNTIAAGSVKNYTWSSSDATPPTIVETPKLYRNTLNDILEVSFSEPLNQSTIANPANYSISPSTVTIQGASSNATFQKVLLTTTPHQPGEIYTLTVRNVTDAAGNVIAAGTFQQYQCLSEDLAAPHLIAARSKSSTSVELEFSEALDQTTATTTSNYSFNPALAVQGASLSSDRLFVTLTTATLQSGGYTVTVQGVGDAALPTNRITTAEKGFLYTAPDVTAPTLAVVQMKNTDGNLLEVVFSEKVNKTTAETTTNYRIEPNVTINWAILSDSTVLLNTNAHAAGNYRLYVSNVTDLAASPNPITANSYREYSFTPPDRTPPQLVGRQLYGNTILDLEFSEPLDLTSSENIANYQITPFVQVNSADRYELNHVRLTTVAHAQGQYTVTVRNVADQADPPNAISSASMQYEFVAADNQPPVLIAVTPSDQYLELEFNDMLDATSAQNTANYQITSSTSQIAIVSAYLSSKKVLLMTGEHTVGTDYTLTVQHIKDMSGNEIVSQDNVKLYRLDSRDKVSPRLTRAELTEDNLLTLYFSEPLDESSARIVNNYSISNGIQVKQVYDLRNNQTEVGLVTDRHTQGNYTVIVAGVKDQAATPNQIVSPDNVANYGYVAMDTIAPILTGAESINPTQVELTFNEPLNPSSVGDTTHYQINNDIRVIQAYLQGTSKIILITTQQKSGGYTVTVSGVEDNSGARNKLIATSQPFNCVIEDKIAPTLMTANMVDSRHLDVTFSEPVDKSSAESIENYDLTSGADILSVKLMQSPNEVILETTEHAPGTYKLTVNGIKDASITQNPIAPFSQTDYRWSPVDSVGPAIVTADLVTNTLLKIQFSEQLDGESAKNPANYSITPLVHIQTAILTDTRDVVQLFTDPHDKGIPYEVKAQNLKDRAFTPNPIGKQNTYRYSYLPPDTSAPKLISCLMNVSPMNLRLVFDEELSIESAQNTGNYQIDGIQVTQATLTASRTEVMLETSSHDAGIRYTIHILGVQDRAPVPNTVTTAIAWDYSYIPADATPPVLVTAKLQSPTELELVFSEAVDQATASVRENYQFNQAVEVEDVMFDAGSPERVYLQTTQHFPDWSYGISVLNVKDRAPRPNSIEPNHWVPYSLSAVGTMADRTAPRLSRVDVVSSSQIDLLFSKPVEKTTAENKSNYTIDDGIVIQSVQLDEKALRVHIKTTAHKIDRSYRVSVSNIKDKAANPNVLSKASSSYLLTKGLSIGCVNPSRYELATCAVGSRGYMDRDYTLTQVPEPLIGAVQILTSNEDKASTGNSFMQFELGGEATVFVGYDKRIETVPEWLSGWTATGEQVVDSRSNVYCLFTKEYTGGRVVLGGNSGTLDDNMYQVMVKPQPSSGKVVSRLSKASYQTSRAATGEESYYIDRTYTLSSIPDSLAGLLMIRTANDDKTNEDAEFLTFTLDQSAKVYVAYDARIKTLPAWLSQWETFDGRIVDSRGQAFGVYFQSFEAGDVTLGGNCGTMDDNMYFVLIQPTGDGAAAEGDLPGYFTLGQNYPNPFNPETRIYYRAHKTGHISLTVFNVLGQSVRVLVDRNVEAGHQEEVVWDGMNQHGQPVASGFYFYRIEQSQFAKTKRMLLLR